jgi:transcriptional regulator with XRE-family HTH domain
MIEENCRNMQMPMLYQPEALVIGKQLRYTRRVKDVTQEELAEAIDVSVGWVSRIERGTKLPNLKLLFRIAKALQVSPNELLPSIRYDASSSPC